MSTTLNIDVGTLPDSLECKITQAQYEDFFSQATVLLPDTYQSVIMQAGVPGVDDQDKPWLKVDANGDQEGLYTYSSNYGSWISPYPVDDDVGIGMIWYGSEAEVTALGGNTDGDVAPTATSGPFWAIKTEMEARFPIGVGDLPSGTAVAVGGTGGEETHTLVEAEIPEHTHNIGTLEDAAGGGAGRYLPNGTQTADKVNVTDAYGGDVDGVTTPHNTLPPYYGVFFLKRTIRKYRRVDA